MLVIHSGVPHSFWYVRTSSHYKSREGLGSGMDRVLIICAAGWTEENIKGYKGPTTEIVAGMASNVRAKLGSTYTISESGTAGPTGGNTPNRTPGYVALAVATESGTYKKELSTGLGGDREGNMIAFAVEALTLLRDVIKGDAKL